MALHTIILILTLMYAIILHVAYFIVEDKLGEISSK